MKTLKRTTTLLLALCLLFSCWGMEADAAVYSSNYFSSYGGFIHNEGGGKIVFSGTITAVHTMERLGITRILIYKGDGTYVKTVYGSTSNGLLWDNRATFGADYTYYGDPNSSYYGVIYFTCRDTNGSDSRHVTTDTV